MPPPLMVKVAGLMVTLIVLTEVSMVSVLMLVSPLAGLSDASSLTLVVEIAPAKVVL